MSTEPREHVLDWLRDAYAMEQQALETCERQVERIENYPDLKDRIARHADETRGQIARLERCFDLLGERPSAVKKAIGWLTGNMQAAGGLLASDEIVKDAMGSYVLENLEIASYTILIAAAQAAGQPEIARLCGETLVEEQAMAEWLRDHLAATTQQFLQRDAAGQRASV
jgi:ferritin-like metal-binding protein YciE